MPSAAQVRPANWTEVTILFDDGSYSVISGKYDGNWGLGERWNGDNGTLGFPNQAGHPIWHVVPYFLAPWILHGLLDKVGRQRPSTTRDGLAHAITAELLEWEAPRVGSG